MKKTKTFLIAECGIMVALATVLSFIKVYEAPYGGSVTLMSMLPIMLVSLRHGIGPGLATGFVHSVIQLLFGLGSVAYVPDAAGIILCILFDYIIPFTAIGLAGAFRKVRFTKSSTVNTIISALLGAVLVMAFRYFCHIISGVVVWYALDLVWYADDPTHIVNKYGSWAFSTIYNGTFMIPEIIITAIGAGAVSVPALKLKK
jgi:thiamine transporter